MKELKLITKTILNQNYFQYGNEFYCQEDGLAMGLSLSGTLSDIYLDNLENKMLNHDNKHSKKILCWHGYVDDVFAV